MTTDGTHQLDPELLVARIIAELQANPEAQALLLRAMLTNEFLGMPARLDRIEKDVADLKADVADLKADMVVVKSDVAGLKTDVGHLKGSDLENRLHRKVRSVIAQALQLRRPRIIQSPIQEPNTEFADNIQAALDDGLISDEQDTRIEATDFILYAQRRSDRVAVWLAVEASSKVDNNDIQRARESADILAAVFELDAIPVVVGYSIDPPDLERARAAGVRYVPVAETG